MVGELCGLRTYSFQWKLDGPPFRLTRYMQLHSSLSVAYVLFFIDAIADTVQQVFKFVLK